MLLDEVAVTATDPCAVATVSAISASTLALPSVSRIGWSRFLPFLSVRVQLPMMFCAPERPIATGTLAIPAPPPAAESETTFASMS